MIPYSRPKRSDLYITYPRVNCLKSIPFTAAHTHIAHIWQYPPQGLGRRHGDTTVTQGSQSVCLHVMARFYANSQSVARIPQPRPTAQLKSNTGLEILIFCITLLARRSFWSTENGWNSIQTSWTGSVGCGDSRPVLYCYSWRWIIRE